MCVVAIVVASLDHLDVGLGDGGLLGELLTQEVEGHVEVAAEEPAYQAEGKHIAALEHRLNIHSRVGQGVLHHRGEGTGDDAVGVHAHFCDVVVGLELRLLEVLLLEGVRVDDDGGIGLGIAQLRLEGGSVHGHEYVAEITGGVNFRSTDVYLEARDTRQRALRGADVGGIVWEGGDTVAHGSRDRGEDVAGELHAVAAVAGEADYHLLQLFDF